MHRIAAVMLGTAALVGVIAPSASADTGPLEVRSYGSPAGGNTVAASQDVYSFLQLFFNRYPKYRNLEFYLFGESYGGHYVPQP